MPLSTNRLLLLSLYGAVVTVALLPLGCGGGRDSQVATPTPGTPTPIGATPTPTPNPAVGRGTAQLTIDWTQPPSGSVPIAANSLTVVVKQGITPIFEQTITRPTASSTSTLSIPNLPAGTLGVLVNAYPTTTGAGVPQASTGFGVTITEGTTTSKTLLLSSSVARVLVTTLQPTLTTTSTSDVFATALNADGNVVLTAPNRWTWSTSAPQIFSLTPNGNLVTVRQADLDGSGNIVARETETGLVGEVALSAPDARQARVTAELSWGARSRSTGGLNSALSARITVEDTRPQGTLSFVANRDSRLTAYTQSYTSPETVRVGPKTITITFFTNADGQGAVVGVAKGTATLLADGTGLGSYTTEGAIKTLTLTLTKSNIFVSRSTSLFAVARNSNNAILALSPGSLAYRVSSGPANAILLGSDGSGNDAVTGLAAGNVQLMASVDGIESAPASLTITPLGGAILDIE
jgi:hypothetical protein